MEPPKQPLLEYVVKLMLLEAADCYHKGNAFGLVWLEKKMFQMQARLDELRRRDG